MTLQGCIVSPYTKNFSDSTYNNAGMTLQGCIASPAWCHSCVGRNLILLKHSCTFNNFYRQFSDIAAVNYFVI
ncbi:MAG: hypothetical protein ACYCTB_06115 [bacterium]